LKNPFADKFIQFKRMYKTVEDVYNSDKNQGKIEKIDRYLDYYTGKYWSDREKQHPEEHGIFANLLFSTAMTIAPLLTDSEPKWNIVAGRPFFQRIAERFKSVADILFEQLEMADKTYDLVIDSLIMTMGIWKIGFDPDAPMFGGEVSVDVVDPRTFVIAPGYTDPWKAPWCATRTRLPMSYIRERWPDAAEDVKPDDEADVAKDRFTQSCRYSTITEIFVRSDIAILDDAEKDYTEEYEVVKKNGEVEKGKRNKFQNGRIIVMAKGIDKPLEDRPFPYTHGKAPFVVLYDYKIPHEFDGMGEADQIETLQLEYNLLLKGVCAYLKKWCLNPDVFVDTSAGIDPEQYKKDAPGGGNCWSIPPGATPPFIAQGAPINPSVYQMIMSIPSIVEEITGNTAISKGQISKKQRQSAHEIAALIETSYTRTRQRVRNLESTLRRALQLIVEIMQQYYTENRTYARKTEGGYEWIDIAATTDSYKKMMDPNNPEKPAPQEEPDEEEMGIKAQQEKDFADLLAYVGDEETVFWPFTIQVDTNSTLPLDRQSLVNMALRLAEIQMTDKSPIDAEFLLDILQIPGAKDIIERKKQQVQAMAVQQQPPQM
jgi:hypothetical protein